MTVSERNNVRVTGRGMPPLLFSHGFGCDQNMWRFVAPAFEDLHQVILFDHVGSGKSDLASYVPGKYGTLQGYANDALEICDELQLEKVVFIGHSVSAIIGLLAVIARPKLFSALVMVSPSPCYLNDGPYRGGFSREDIMGLLEFMDSNYLGWSQMMAPKIMGTPDRPELELELTNSFCRTDPKIAKHFARVTFLSDNRNDLPRLQVPTLILQTHPDLIASVDVGRYVHEKIPQSQLVLLNASGHCPNLSAPDQTVAEIKRFLQNLS